MDPMLDPALFQLLFGGGAAASPAMVPGSGTPMAVPPVMAPPAPRPPESYMTDPLLPGTPPVAQPQVPMPPSRPASLGAVLDPASTMSGAMGGVAAAGDASPMGAAGGMGGDPSRLAAALKGVVAPAPPVSQKVSTPHAPQMAKLPGGNVAELLAQLGIGPQQAFPGLKLPSTLGQALGG